MVKNNHLIGYRLLQSATTANTSLKLISRGEERYVVLLTQYLLGLPLRQRRFEFGRYTEAQHLFDRLAQQRLQRRRPFLLF